MDELIAQAEKLGKTIASNDRFQALRNAEKQVSQDPKAGEIQQALETHMNHISELEASGKPVEVADKRRLDQLQNEFRSQPALQQLVKAQADYLEMMNRVNQTIVDCLRFTEESAR